MAISTLAELVDFIRQLRLLEPAQMEELTRDLQARFPDPRALARELVKREWLTTFQVNELALGRGQGLLVGSYLLLEKLGEGGMGEVYKARNQKLGKIVALKVIRKDRLARADTVRRFYREIHAAAKLNHPNVIRAIDADQAGDIHYFAMEYVESVDLAQVLRERGPLPVAEACEYIRQAAMGLQHGYERGMIHRDIKPSNLLLTGKPDTPYRKRTVKVLDMGLALLVNGSDEESSSTLTEAGAVMGTPDFVSPEQARNSHEVDTRADLYSLGCTLYLLLTGQVPFPGDTLTEKLLKHQLDEPKPLEVLRPGLSPAVAAVVRRLMAKKPEDRYRNPAELAGILAALMASLSEGGDHSTVDPGSAISGPHWSSVVTPMSTDDDLAPAAMPKPARRRRGWLWAGVGGALLAAGVAIWLLLPGSQKPSEKKQEGPALVPVPVQVEAGKPWQDTKVDIPKGATFKVTVAGSWRKGQGEMCAAEGLPKVARDRAVLPVAPAMCLLGRVGRFPTVYFLKPGQPLEVKGSGRLFLQANDLDVEQNAGTLEVKIEGGKRNEASAPAPGPTRIEEAENGLKALLARLGDVKADRAKLRQSALAFRNEFPGTFQSARAGGLLMELPSPLDNLEAGKHAFWEGQPVKPPNQLTAIFGNLRWRSWGNVSRVAFSKNGKLLATTSPKEQVIRILDAATGKPMAVLNGPLSAVAPVAFSPEGDILASASFDGTIALWDLATGQKRATLNGHKGEVNALAFTLLGRTLASGGADKTVRVWDLAAGNKSELLAGHNGPVVSLAFAKDGKTLASASFNGDVRLWDWKGKKGQVIFADHLGWSDVAFSPDGTILATGVRGNTIRLWTVATRKVLTTLPAGGDVWKIAFTPDGKTLVAITDTGKTLRFWDVASKKERAALKNPSPRRFDGLAIAADGKVLATGNADGIVRLWDPATAKELAIFPGGPAPIINLAYAPDSSTFATAAGGLDQPGFVGLRDPATGKVIATLKGHANKVTGVAYASDGKIIATASRDKTVLLWDVAGVKNGAVLAPRRILKGHTLPINCVAIARGGKLLASGGADNIKLWDLTGSGPGKELAPTANLEGHAGAVLALAFSSDGKLLASGGNEGDVVVWDTAARKKLATLAGHNRAVLALAFSRNGRWLVSGSSIPAGKLATGDIKVWAVPAADEKWAPLPRLTLRGHSAAVASLAFATDGVTLVSAGQDGAIKLWEADTGREFAEIRGHRGPIVGAVFAPNGRTLVTASARAIKVWDAATGTERNPIPGHTGPVNALAFSPEGLTLATGSNDWTIRLWDAATGKERTILRGHTAKVNSVVFAPDGRTVISGSSDKTIKIWDLVTGRELRTLTGDNPIWALAIRGDGALLAARREDGTGRVYDLATGKETRALKLPDGKINCLTFHPDGRVLATGGNAAKVIQTWDSATLKELSFLRLLPKAFATSLAFSPDGRLLAGVSANIPRALRIWQAPALQELGSWDQASCTWVEFRPDGRILGCFTYTGWAWLWEVGNGNVQAKIQIGAAYYIRQFTFSPDGRYLATANNNGTAYILRLAPVPKR